MLKNVPQQLTIADIIADPTLDTRLLSGERGIARPVSWAHSCEMPDPGKWLRNNELLMTVGLCVPAGAEAQRAFIASLDDAGLAGITIGDDLLSPELTPELFEESDKLGFPVLATGHTIPFVALSRMVAFSNADAQSRVLLLLSRLYQTAAKRDSKSKRTGKPLADLFNTDIKVIDDQTGCVVIGQGVVDFNMACTRPLRTIRPTSLVLSQNDSLDSFSLLHLAQVITVDANEVLQGALDAYRSAREAFDRALAGGVTAGGGAIPGWPKNSSFYVVATSNDSELRLGLSLALAGLDAATTHKNGYQIVVVQTCDVGRLRTLLAQLQQPGARSGEYYDARDLLGAANEAIVELQVGLSHKDQWREFAGEQVSLLARSHSEQQRIVQSVLGALAVDDRRMEPIRRTLFEFLDTDMHWQETAKRLGLHRQTVVYRLGRVAAITGRSVRNTRDLAELYLARVAWDQLRRLD